MTVCKFLIKILQSDKFSKSYKTDLDFLGIVLEYLNHLDLDLNCLDLEFLSSIRSFSTVQNIPKNLNSSHKTDLDFLGLF